MTSCHVGVAASLQVRLRFDNSSVRRSRGRFHDVHAAKPMLIWRQEEVKLMVAAEKSNNIYGEVTSPNSLREINRMIRRDMRTVKQQEQLTELKRRSDYLATLTRSPAWKTRFGGKIGQLTEVAKEENHRSVRIANQLAKKHGWDVEYDPWGKD
jgi:hypothetical protein